MNIAPSDIKSRPVYAPLQPDPAATRHWLVLETGAMNRQAVDELIEMFRPVTASLHIWAVGSEDAASTALSMLPDLPALSQALGDRGPFHVSDRFYVQGTEPFLWSVAGEAGRVGFAPAQIRLAHTGSLRRRVWCTHCHGLTENVTTQVVACAGCGRHLLVRDHFSRRHAAFMGVMVDAEVPGERPAIEEVFP